MKTIGLYLGTLPSGGGAFQYNLTVTKAMQTLDPKSYRVHCFYVDRELEPYIPQDFGRTFSRMPFHRRALGAAYRKLTGDRDGRIPFASFFYPWVGDINRSDCDLVIFPSQDSASYLVDKPSITTIHDVMHRYEPHFEEYREPNYSRRERLYGSICRHVDMILVDSEVGKRHVMECYNRDPVGITVLPFVAPHYLLECKEVDVRAKYGLPERYVFYPAQFWEHKNHLNLLKAISLLNDQGQKVNLVLVGSKKNHYERVLAAIENMGLKEQVFILGYVSNDDMYSLYRQAVALAFVSLLGPTNIPPVEAMLVGCPAVISNAYGMPEQVGDAALLVNPKDPADIASGIARVWNDEALRRALVEKGRMQVQKYSEEGFTRHLKDVVDTMLAAGSA